jgi:hypothetical protein
VPIGEPMVFHKLAAAIARKVYYIQAAAAAIDT